MNFLWFTLFKNCTTTSVYISSHRTISLTISIPETASCFVVGKYWDDWQNNSTKISVSFSWPRQPRPKSTKRGEFCEREWCRRHGKWLFFKKKYRTIHFLFHLLLLSKTVGWTSVRFHRMFFNLPLLGKGNVISCLSLLFRE